MQIFFGCFFPFAILIRILETAFEKVLRRVLRRCLAVDFILEGRRVFRRGSKKGLLERHLEEKHAFSRVRAPSRAPYKHGLLGVFFPFVKHVLGPCPSSNSCWVCQEREEVASNTLPFGTVCNRAGPISLTQQSGRKLVY